MLRRTMMAGQTAPPPTGYRYWRLYITANNGSTQYTNVGELQFRATLGGASMVPVQSINTADLLFSSQLAGGTNDAWLAFDGVVTGSPWITAINLAVPSYIGWDFGTEVSVAQFGVGINTLSAINRSPKDFEMQASNDNLSWTTMKSVTNQTNASVWNPAANSLVLYNL